MLLRGNEQTENITAQMSTCAFAPHESDVARLLLLLLLVVVVAVTLFVLLFLVVASYLHLYLSTIWLGWFAGSATGSCACWGV